MDNSDSNHKKDLPQAIKERLYKNHGEVAESMNCYCEVKFIDPVLSWACYVYSLDCGDDDTIDCIITHHNNFEVRKWSLLDLYASYNHEGEHPVIDCEYRRILTSTLINKLDGRHGQTRNY